MLKVSNLRAIVGLKKGIGGPMMNIELAKEMNIPVVEDRHYWFVRTTGGTHYEDFTTNGYISIGWDYLSIEYFRKNPEEVVKKQIEKSERNQPTEAEDSRGESGRALKQAVTMIYNKIDRFVNQFNLGDVVLVPSKNSEKLAIGIITSDVYEDSTYVQKFIVLNPDSEIVPCPYYKRRNVKWIKGIEKSQIDIFLAKALNAQHSISNIDDCASLINRSIYNFYATDTDIHAIIHAGHPDGLSLKELKDLVNALDAGLAMGADVAGENYDPNQIDVKITIHSPGLLEICGLIATSGLTISVMLFALSHYRHGGKAKGKFQCKFGEMELSFEYDHESKGELEYQQGAKKLNAEILENLISLEKKLDITYPEIPEVEIKK